MQHLFLGGLSAYWHQLLENYDFSASFSGLCNVGCIPLLLSQPEHPMDAGTWQRAKRLIQNSVVWKARGGCRNVGLERVARVNCQNVKKHKAQTAYEYLGQFNDIKKNNDDKRRNQKWLETSGCICRFLCIPLPCCSSSSFIFMQLYLTSLK